ncbi:quinone oxidoreductase [Actinospica sp.]|jgi:NADPH2:quinone reductase|uniref:quinone oxidoreductase family protein n=1 Tax=Actinospica sp. TaxID=1872142 RepID=UPI002D13D60E|nr:quinone oxidoreductase [Actinospica sp.]HWG24123.1 quinone oxidoreductase [Actinospica sp.]
MLAAYVTKTGGPEVLEHTEVEAPAVGPGRVLVKVAAAGVNFIDIYFRIGQYPRPLPAVLGGEGAGTVVELGEGVTGLAVGDRVAWADGNTGSYAEYDVVDADRLVHVPDGVDLETAAASMLQGMTAHYLTNSTWPLKAGETALVHAAAGGMGLLLSQIGKARGARVIGTTSTEAKAALAREAGADVVINYTEVEDLAAEVRELTDGRGVDVVYDGVGKTTFEASLGSLRKRGLLALYGAASGPVPPFDPQLLNRMGSLFLTRPTLMDHIATREELEWRAGETLAAVADGSLRINIGRRFPLAQAAEAHTALAGRATTGKVLLIP